MFDREELVAIFHGLELQIATLRVTIDIQTSNEGRREVAQRMSYLKRLSEKIQSEIRSMTKYRAFWDGEKD